MCLSYAGNSYHDTEAQVLGKVCKVCPSSGASTFPRGCGWSFADTKLNIPPIKPDKAFFDSNTISFESSLVLSLDAIVLPISDL